MEDVSFWLKVQERNMQKLCCVVAAGCRQGCLRSARPLRGGRRCVEDVSFWLKVQERNMQKLAAAGCGGRRGRRLSWPLAVMVVGCAQNVGNCNNYANNYGNNYAIPLEM